MKTNEKSRRCYVSNSLPVLAHQLRVSSETLCRGIVVER
jgi:hypothetical protein